MAEGGTPEKENPIQGQLFQFNSAWSRNTTLLQAQNSIRASTKLGSQTSHPTLTQHEDTIMVSSICPDHRWNGDCVVAEVYKYVYVVPVIEHIRIAYCCTLDEPANSKERK